MSDQSAYTRIPNAILDNMALFTEPELRVLLAVARKTIGWQKECDPISLTQLEGLTGLSRPAVNKALHHAIERGWIECTGRGKQGVGCYKIGTGLVNDVNQLTTLTSEQRLLGSVNVVNRSSPELVNDVNTQKKRSKEKKEKGEGTQGRTPPKQGTLDSFHEAVTTYKQLTGRRTITPNMATLIASTVTDIPKWQATINAWCGRGFNSGNITGMLDWYAHPEKTEHRNGHRNDSRPIRQNTRQNPEWQEWAPTDLDKPF